MFNMINSFYFYSKTKLNIYFWICLVGHTHSSTLKHIYYKGKVKEQIFCIFVSKEDDKVLIILNLTDLKSYILVEMQVCC